MGVKARQDLVLVCHEGRQAKGLEYGLVKIVILVSYRWLVIAGLTCAILGSCCIC